MKVRKSLLKNFHSFIEFVFIKPGVVLHSGDKKVSKSDLVFTPSGGKLTKSASERISKGSKLRSLDFSLRYLWNY